MFYPDSGGPCPLHTHKEFGWISVASREALGPEVGENISGSEHWDVHEIICCRTVVFDQVLISIFSNPGRGIAILLLSKKLSM